MAFSAIKDIMFSGLVMLAAFSLVLWTLEHIISLIWASHLQKHCELIHLLNKTDYSQSNFLLLDGSLLFMFIVKVIDTSARLCGSVCQRQTHSFTQSIKIHDAAWQRSWRDTESLQSLGQNTHTHKYTGLPLHTWHSNNLCLTRLYRTLCAFLLNFFFPILFCVSLNVSFWLQR